MPGQVCSTKKSLRPSVIVPTLRALVAAALLYLLYWLGLFNPSQLGTAIVHPWPAGGAVLCLLATSPIGALRWWGLLRAQGINLPKRKVFGIFFIGVFANTYLLGSVGGDVVRAAYVCDRNQGSRAPALASIILDRIMGLMALVTMTVLLLPANMGMLRSSPLLGAMAYSLVSLFFVLWAMLISSLFFSRTLADYGHRRHWDCGDHLNARLWRLLNALAISRHRPGLLLICLGLSLLIQALSMAGIVLACWSVGENHLTVLNYAFAGSLALVANILPVTPGGLGVGEGAFAKICMLLAPASSQLGYAGVFLVFRGMTLVASLPGLLAYVLVKRRANS